MPLSIVKKSEEKLITPIAKDEMIPVRLRLKISKLKISIQINGMSLKVK